MDDVITDLRQEFLSGTNYTDQEYKEKVGDKLFWHHVNEMGLKFWSKMRWTPNGKKLWKLLLPYNPVILSACNPQGKYVLAGKKLWIKKNLGNVNYILCLRKDKKKYAHSSAILIDDREDNIKEWEQSGGIGILYHDDNFNEIKSKIKEYL